VVLAFYIVTVPVTGAVQWLLLFVCAILGTFVLYEVVRRVDALRFLFGMKGRPPAPKPATVTVAASDGRKDRG
jgi:glucans biosynthesis protein C